MYDSEPARFDPSRGNHTPRPGPRQESTRSFVFRPDPDPVIRSPHGAGGASRVRSNRRPTAQIGTLPHMGTLEQLLAITRNTFFESIRQPVLLVVLVICTILVVLSNPFSAYTLQDDNKMFVDIGLSTIFMGTAILSAFIASNVLTREIENRTVLTVVSKPVSRPIFVIGKYLGIAAAQTLALLFLTLAFMMVEIHGVQQTVTTPYHQPVIIFGFGSMLLGAGIGIWCNYFYGWVFSSTFLVATTPVLLVSYLLCLFLDHEFATQAPSVSFQGGLWVAAFVLGLGALVLTAIAITASTRLGQVLTLMVTVGFFILGLLSDWLFGRKVDEYAAVFETLEQTGASPTLGMVAWAWLFKVAYSVVPNFQVFWLADAVTQEATIPGDYLAWTIPYGILFIVICLSLAVMLFQRREVG